MSKGQFPSEQSDAGEFKRQPDEFRDWVRRDGSTPFAPEAGRYQLYISLACPWACRAWIALRLKGLESAVGVTVVDPIRNDDDGWTFYGRDPITGFRLLKEAYFATNRHFKGRWTVPVLWDRRQKRIVNNSEDDLCRMFNDEFGAAADTPDWFPRHLAAEQTALSELIYEKINNGVYRAGFATRQEAYAAAARAVFAALDQMEERLKSRRFLLADHPVESDWRLFCTLIRFDAVYHGHFKCNVRRIVDYPHLQRFLEELFGLPGIADTVNFDHIKRHYYITHHEINPTGIVPIGPALTPGLRPAE